MPERFEMSSITNMALGRLRETGCRTETFSDRGQGCSRAAVLVLSLVGMLLLPLASRGEPPLADVHVHFKWNQAEVTSKEQAVAILRTNAIALAVVIGLPAGYALDLKALAPKLIVPIWSPYQMPADWSTWAFDEGVLVRARAALASGRYFGIGELHLIGGFTPDWRTPVISGLMGLAAEYDLPLLLHTEISQTAYLSGLCRAYPEARILWAHAGGILRADQVAEVMGGCPNLWVELSARDPWRYVNNPITDAEGSLLPEWRRLIESFPDRFMVGSDPVWPVERLDSWDEPDSGWEQYGRFVRFHREWLRQLPASISEKLRLTNARVLFKKTGSVPQSNPSEAGKRERRRSEGQSRDLSFNTRDRMYPSVCRPLCRCL